MSGQHPKLSRVLDANLNRAREGLRVCEELARLVLRDPRLTRRFQALRYALEGTARRAGSPRWMQSRDVRRDVGRPSRRGQASPHRNYPSLAAANVRRVEEALRVLEEFSRLKSARSAQSFGSLRFRCYSLEQALFSKLSALRHR